MIKYSMKCSDGHAFDSWFGSGEDFDRLSKSGLLSCAVCGIETVEKSVMAPRVAKSSEGPLSQPASPAEQALRALREKFEAEADNVGRGFATEARKIHDGEAPARPIYGEARIADAKALVDDGIPVAPLPWGHRKTN